MVKINIPPNAQKFENKEELDITFHLFFHFTDYQDIDLNI